MRVTAEQINIFKTFACRYFGEDVELWLFGSRTDDSKRGGDYDFLIETSMSDADRIIASKIDLIADLQNTNSFEDERIDIIVKRRFSAFNMPVYQVAKHEGVRL